MTTKKDFVLLASIVAAMGNAATPFLFVADTELKGLIKDKLVETNPELKDEAGKVATRATEAGIAASKANDEKAGTAVASAPKPELTIGTGFVVPEGAASVRKAELYPFDTLAVGGFIFVPTSEAKPDPAKSLASTVSAATKRYAVEIAGQTRQDRNGKTVPATYNTRVFTVVPVKSGVAYGEFTAPSDGAAIVRLPDAVKPEPATAAA